jgi:hypothetical protein
VAKDKTEAFDGFDGWEVEYVPERNEFNGVKYAEGGKPDPEGNPRLTVTTRGPKDLDPDLLFDYFKRDCYLEDVRCGTFPEAAAKFAEADRAVAVQKVRRALATGGGEDKAEERLANAGVPDDEAEKILTSKG